jgi:hypothetical protein
MRNSGRRRLHLVLLLLRVRGCHVLAMLLLLLLLCGCRRRRCCCCRRRHGRSLLLLCLCLLRLRHLHVLGHSCSLLLLRIHGCLVLRSGAFPLRLWLLIITFRLSITTCSFLLPLVSGCYLWPLRRVQ